MNDERGIITIYFSIVMICIIFIIFILLDVARIKYNDNKLKMAGLVAGHSILADYNNELWNRYGLLTLRDLDSYIVEENFKQSLLKNIVSNDMSRIKIVSTHISNDSSLCSSDELENQIIEHMKSMALEKTFDFMLSKLNEDLSYTNASENDEVDILTEEEWNSKTSSIADKREENLEDAERYIESTDRDDIVIPEALLENLPSKSQSKYEKSKVEYDTLVKDSKGLYESMIKMIPLSDYLNIYILDKFSTYLLNNNNVNVNEDEDEDEEVDEEKEDGKSKNYFDLEVEYIICGSSSQNENLKEIKRKLIMCRLPIHIARIYKDAALMAEIEAAAQLAVGWWATPLAATLLKNAMVCSIALIDSKNDVAKLLNGEKIKISNDTEIYIDYAGYLHLLLLTVSKEDKLNRIKDIIYLNMNNINFQFLLDNALTKFNVDIAYKDNLMLMDKVKYSSLYDIQNKERKVTICLGY